MRSAGFTGAVDFSHLFGQAQRPPLVMLQMPVDVAPVDWGVAIERVLTLIRCALPCVAELDAASSLLEVLSDQQSARVCLADGLILVFAIPGAGLGARVVLGPGN